MKLVPLSKIKWIDIYISAKQNYEI
jgi:hypothetical protein